MQRNPGLYHLRFTFRYPLFRIKPQLELTDSPKYESVRTETKHGELVRRFGANRVRLKISHSAFFLEFGEALRVSSTFQRSPGVVTKHRSAGNEEY